VQLRLAGELGCVACRLHLLPPTRLFVRVRHNVIKPRWHKRDSLLINDHFAPPH
jgi:hypothetical protein